ncbi:hypothetical protein O9H85_00840 [Paenibacillus filicis]|uniref:Uncharacterized protein n=1 Tax=Paenibacillus gyeongsangnamensis TaxID=3388067 RepID=A0ABT4Q294_9BACL|nr:hypothetical protein [Paenibacillus filicis]MCZ8511002.1 hypothetical protein [Paenibacillus filicis]
MMHIQFRDIQVRTVSKSSGIFTGSNMQWKFKQHSKQNQSMGTVTGHHCLITDLRAEIDDGDDFDTISKDK